MARNVLPKPAIVIADDNDDSLDKLYRDTQSVSDDWVLKSLGSSLLGAPQIIRCSTLRQLQREMKRAPGQFEPCLLITDSVGMGYLDERHRSNLLPLMKVVLHTNSKSDSEFVKLFKDRKINVPLHKGDPEALRKCMFSLYEEYWNQSVLRQLRYHISFGSENPTRKCYQRPGEAEDYMNLFDIYREVLSGSELGKRLAFLWNELEAIHC